MASPQEQLRTFSRFDLHGAAIDSVQASYMVQDGSMVKLFRNQDGNSTEDQLVAVINTDTGFAVIDRSTKV